MSTSLKQKDPAGKVNSAVYVEDIAAEPVHQVNDNAEFADLVRDAKAASDTEHRMTLMQGLRTYPKAMGWSLALSTCIIMEGYDTVLLGNFYAMTAFNQKYGTLDSSGAYSLSAAWQVGLSDGAGVGEILGLLVSGMLADRFGYRRVLAGALIMITAFIFINFFAPSLIALEMGLVLCGIPWGVFQTITTTFAAEVCPVNLRCYLTTYVNLCWVIGQLIGSGVLRGCCLWTINGLTRSLLQSSGSGRLPILVAVCLAPESPWWLIRKGRVEEAERAVSRLARKETGSFNAKETVAFMVHTNEVEKTIQSGTSYLDCFRGRSQSSKDGNRLRYLGLSIRMRIIFHGQFYLLSTNKPASPLRIPSTLVSLSMFSGPSALLPRGS